MEKNNLKRMNKKKRLHKKNDAHKKKAKKKKRKKKNENKNKNKKKRKHWYETRKKTLITRCKKKTETMTDQLKQYIVQCNLRQHQFLFNKFICQYGETVMYIHLFDFFGQLHYYSVRPFWSWSSYSICHMFIFY